MNTRAGIRNSLAVLASAGCMVVVAMTPASAQTALTPGAGSIEFTASVKPGAGTFPKKADVFRGTASDGSERIEATVSGADLVVIREVQPCLRLSARLQGVVERQKATKISLRWHGASASVSFGGKTEVALEPARSDALPPFTRSSLVVGGRDVDATGLVVDRMQALAESPADRAVVQQGKCFSPAAAANGPVQESYRGVALRGLSDAAQKASVKKWIDEMNPALRAVVKSVSVTDEGEQTWRGLSLPGAQQAILLRPSVTSEPSVFYHEAAHLLDAQHGGRDSADWGTRFMGLPAKAASGSGGIMGHLDAGAPQEQLAEFVARARMESLGFARAHLCANESACGDKVNFLAGRGYLSTADASALASRNTALAAAPANAERSASSSGNAAHSLPIANVFYKTKPIVIASNAGPVEITLDARFFRPIDLYHDGGLIVPPTWRGCKPEDVMNRLVQKRPAEIVSEPPLKGVLRKYGYFDFGTKKIKRHYFALDEMADGTIEMHYDANANGRLDDDGPARPHGGQHKAGEKSYAALLEIPWTDVMDNPPWSGYFKLWFMSNAFEWSIAGFSKSSHTQLIGSIDLAGQAYEIIVADTAVTDNDGDLTNDGFCLRKSGQKAVCYTAAESRSGIAIDGRRYLFGIRYP